MLHTGNGKETVQRGKNSTCRDKPQTTARSPEVEKQEEESLSRLSMQELDPRKGSSVFFEKLKNPSSGRKGVGGQERWRNFIF